MEGKGSGIWPLADTDMVWKFSSVFESWQELNISGFVLPRSGKMLAGMKKIIESIQWNK